MANRTQMQAIIDREGELKWAEIWQRAANEPINCDKTPFACKGCRKACDKSQSPYGFCSVVCANHYYKEEIDLVEGIKALDREGIFGKIKDTRYNITRDEWQKEIDDNCGGKFIVLDNNLKETDEQRKPKKEPIFIRCKYCGWLSCIDISMYGFCKYSCLNNYFDQKQDIALEEFIKNNKLNE
jgi:hypothetical protein